MYRNWTSLISASLATVCFALVAASAQAQCYPNNLCCTTNCRSPLTTIGYCGSGPGRCCGYGYQGYPGYQYSYAAGMRVGCSPGFESCGEYFSGMKQMYNNCNRMNACGQPICGGSWGCGCRTGCGTGCGLASPVIAASCCSPSPNCCAVMSNSAVMTRPANVAPAPTTTAPMPTYNTTAEPATVEPKPVAVEPAPAPADAAAAAETEAPKPGI